MPDTDTLNLDFEAGRNVTGRPKKWGGGGQGYALTVDEDAPHGGQYCGRIEYIGPSSDSGFGTFTHCTTAQPYLGKRVRYAGWLKSRDVEEWAGLWMRVDGASGQRSLAFDNMQNRGVQGTTDWTRYEVVLDVAPDATQICFGFLLHDAGTLWGDDLEIEIIGPEGQGPDTTGFPTGAHKEEKPVLQAAQMAEQISAMQAEINALKASVARLEKDLQNNPR